MGSALGARLRDGGARALVALDGRSERSRQLARDAGLENVGTLEALLSRSDVVLSVVPPGSAEEVAARIAEATGDAQPLVADLNAIAPATAQRVAAVLAERGIDMVDGSISGPPPSASGTTRVYLSGPRAAEIAALPLDGVDRIVVSDVVGARLGREDVHGVGLQGPCRPPHAGTASRDAHGVVDHVLDDLVETGLADPTRDGATLARASAKAWRYVAEMEEIADTQAAAGLTPDLFLAVAPVYAELAGRALAAAPEDVPDDMPLADVLRRLSAEAEGRAVAEGP